MAVITLTREQLYERVWQTPSLHLRKEFGLSDVGLAKLCKRHKVTKPSLGYWARKSAGGKPKVTPLPVCNDSSIATIQFAQPEPTVQESEFFDSEIEALYQKERQRAAHRSGDANHECPAQGITRAGLHD